MPGVIGVVVGGVVLLPGRQDGTQPRLVLFRRHQLRHRRMDRLIHGREAKILLDLAGKPLRLLAPRRGAAQHEIAVGECRDRVVRQTGARLRHPLLAYGAMGDFRHMLGIIVEDGVDALLHRQCRAAARILDLAEAGREVVGRRLAAGEDRLVDRPAAGMGQARFLGHLAGHVHEADGIDAARCSRRHMHRGTFAHAHAVPLLRVQAFEGVHAAPIRTAMGIPDHRVGMGHGEGGVKADGRVEPVVIAMGRMHGLGSAHLLRRLAEEDERAGQLVLFHGGLGGKRTAECAQPQCRMRIGMTRGMAMHAFARLFVGHRLLAVAGHRIIFGIARDHRLAGSEPRAERRRHAGGACLDLEPLLAQQRHIPGSRPVFAPRALMKIPHLGVALRKPGLVALDPVEGALLGGGHGGGAAGLGCEVIIGHGNAPWLCRIVAPVTFCRKWRGRAPLLSPSPPSGV